MRTLQAVRGALCAVVIAGLAGSVAAQPAAPSAEGRWTTYDDVSGKPRALVRIEAQAGVLVGRIERLLDPTDDPGARCEACTGDLKDQPIIGLAFLRGLRPVEGEPGSWAGGEIVDPDDGTRYRARMRLRRDGTELEVRGYLLVSMFGRSQVWRRSD